MTLIEFHGSGCPECGGTVGPHSDICLDCGYDECETLDRWIDRFFRFAFIVIAILVPVWAILEMRLG